MEKHARICLQLFPINGRRITLEPRSLGHRVCPIPLRAMQWCQALFQWSLKMIRVLQPKWCRGFLVTHSSWLPVRLFRSGPARIRKQQATGRLLFPQARRVISF